MRALLAHTMCLRSHCKRPGFGCNTLLRSFRRSCRTICNNLVQAQVWAVALVRAWAVALAVGSVQVWAAESVAPEWAVGSVALVWAAESAPAWAVESVAPAWAAESAVD